MGKIVSGDKPKFDLITASKSKKYKIITAVVLIIGLLLLGGGLLMKNMITSAVIPNTLQISELSGMSSKNSQLVCDISIDQSFMIKTGTTEERALVQPIIFTLLDGAENFLEVRDVTNTYQINESYYSGLFYLHIREDAPAYVTVEDKQIKPTGKLRITCGSFMKEITFTYYHQN